MIRVGKATALLAAACLGWANAAAAQEAAPAAQDAGADKSLSIELNKSADAGAGCRLTFVAKNDTGAALDKASYEIAVFDGRNRVARLLIFEFGSLALGKTLVREFEYPDLTCANISRILVNTAPECIAGGQSSPVCLGSLRTSSLSSIAFNQ